MISKGTLKHVRALYQARWGRNWPFEDEYLKELILEAKKGLSLAPNAKHRYGEVYEETLDLMRSDHVFEEEEK